jgi:hypothetical protein
MDRDGFQEVLRKRPFKPVEVGLTDGRSILVRHPDQAMITRRTVIFGLTHVKNGRKRLVTSDNDDRVVEDWLMIDLLHIVSAERISEAPSKRPRRRRTR